MQHIDNRFTALSTINVITHTKLSDDGGMETGKVNDKQYLV